MRDGYLAMVLEVFSRLVVGWAMASRMLTELVIKALEMAVATRRPRAVVNHSDKGSQYTSVAFGQRSREMGVRLSTGPVGECFDNAMAESFFATLEKELLGEELIVEKPGSVMICLLHSFLLVRDGIYMQFGSGRGGILPRFGPILDVQLARLFQLLNFRTKQYTNYYRQDCKYGIINPVTL